MVWAHLGITAPLGGLQGMAAGVRKHEHPTTSDFRSFRLGPSPTILQTVQGSLEPIQLTLLDRES